MSNVQAGIAHEIKKTEETLMSTWDNQWGGGNLSCLSSKQCNLNKIFKGALNCC